MPRQQAQTEDIATAAITNAKRADMAQATVSGRAVGAGTGVPTDLTEAQIVAILSGNYDAAGAATTAETNAKAYADGLVVGLLDDRGSFDASGGAYPSTGGSGTAGAILKGDIWAISVAGTLPTGQVVDVGDWVRALIDTPGNTQANWGITQNNIGYVAENSANKSTNVNADQASNVKYPSVKAVYDWAVGMFQVAGAYLTAVTADAPLSGAGTSASHLVIAAATTSVPGSMSAADKTKLDGVESGAEVNNISDVNAVDLTDGGTTDLHSHNYLSILKSLINQSGKKIIFLDLTTYDVIDTFVSGSGFIGQAFTIAYVTTGTTADSAARQNVNSPQLLTYGAISGRVYFADVSANYVMFWGIRDALLTNQQTHVDTTIHAGFYYHNAQWYASNGNATAQTLTAIAVSAGQHVFRIEGTSTTNQRFYVDDVLVATHTTNIPADNGYFEIYVNNKALTSSKTFYFYSMGYSGT